MNIRAALVLVCLGTWSTLSQPTWAIEFTPCHLSGSGGSGNLAALCGEWVQPLDPEKPNGETITLSVTKLPSTALEPAADAFTLINGGPGGSSIDMLVDMAGIASSFTRERDVIVIDQRGTGRSAPMRCDALTDTTNEVDFEDIVPLTEMCLQNLPWQPEFFSTTVAVQDLENLRQALGYQQWSIYGVSYGTRVAMQYLRQFPDSVRSIVIDGVVPPDEVLGANIAMHSETALQQVFERCAQDASCNTAFPNLPADFAKLKADLKRAPVSTLINHPITGEPTDVELTYDHLAVWLRLALYGPETSSLIPLIIHEAAAGKNYGSIAANALRLIDNLTNALNYGMHNAVMCTEDAPFYNDQQIDMEALEATYIGSAMYKTLDAMCSVWPQGPIHPQMKEPVTSDLPVLVLSGEFDPITPPAWGEAVMPGLSNAVHLVAPGQGHGTIARGCMPKLILEFVEDPKPQDIDASCLTHLAPSPFFINSLGPAP